jgi:tetratricopeptide (TPR) repeat protein
MSMPLDPLTEPIVRGADRAPAAAGDFVGRDGEMDRLRAALAEACHGRTQVLLVSGHPGIGKTRLAFEFALSAARLGAVTAWGRGCEGGGTPAYWPWAQALRVVFEKVPASDLASRLGIGATYLAQIVPGLAVSIGDAAVPPPPLLQPDQTRFHLFDAVTTLIRLAAERAPLVLLLDDLHAFDAPSLLLFQYVARELRDARVVLVGCARSEEPGTNSQLLLELASTAHRIPLRGLDTASVWRFAAHVAGRRPSGAFVAALQRATDGNPLFIDELLRLLEVERCDAEVDALTEAGWPIPDGARAMVRRRLGPMSPLAVKVLTIASVIGREFDLACLARVSGLPEPRVAHALNEGLAAGIIAELAGHAGRYTFGHALLRAAIYDAARPTSRARWHRQVAAFLEDRHRLDARSHLAELAYHYVAGAAGGDRRKAVEYSAGAGDQAFAQLGYEDAAIHYRHAVHALEQLGGHERRRSELLLSLGESQDRAGASEEARTSFEHAAELARGLCAWDLYARAALGVGGLWALKFLPSPTDAREAALLTEALAALDGVDTPLRGQVESRLGLKLCVTGARERGAALCESAVAMARRLGDTDTLAYALCAQHAALMHPDHLEQRLRAADEILWLAERTGNKEFALRGHALRLYDLLELGDIGGADAAMRMHAVLTTETRQPFDLWFRAVLLAMRALLEGSFGEAETLADEALAVARRVGTQQAAGENAMQAYCAHRLILTRELGRDEEFSGMTEAAVTRFPQMSVWRATAADFHADRGHAVAARREYEALAVRDFAGVEMDATWLVGMWFLADACARLGDRNSAALLAARLQPYGGRVAVVGGVACLGSMALPLGRLAATLRNWDEAVRRFEAAIDVNTRLGARPWAAYARCAYAEMLVARNAPGDHERACDLAGDARDVARTLGMAPLVRAADRLLHDASASADGTVRPQAASAAAEAPAARRRIRTARPAQTGTRAGKGSVFRLEGEYWTIAHAGVLCRLRSSKGLYYLAELLRRSGSQVHVLDLLMSAPRSEPPFPTEVPTAQSSARGQEILDARARHALKERLADLMAEADTARANRDSGRLDHLQEEINFITHELAAALGLGGRRREPGSTVERARLSVTKAIRNALRHLTKHHPRMGDHLRACVHTGVFCSYAPDPLANVTWEL